MPQCAGVRQSTGSPVDRNPEEPANRWQVITHLTLTAVLQAHHRDADWWSTSHTFATSVGTAPTSGEVFRIGHGADVSAGVGRGEGGARHGETRAECRSDSGAGARGWSGERLSKAGRTWSSSAR